MLRFFGIVCLLVFVAVLSGHTQSVPLNAMVADSATLKPIPFVTVRVNNSFRGTMTNEQGYFVIQASASDTLTFSIVGYHPKKIAAAEIFKASVVYMAQAIQMLKPIEFTGTIDISSMLPKLDAPSVYQNSTYSPQTDRPVVTGFQGFQTFGPGYVARGGDLKPSKEEQKLEKIKKENVAAKGYVALVNDPEVKDKLIKEYQLTEAEYYDHLANFNQKNKDFIYHLDDTDVVQLIFKYFAENLKK